MGAASGKTTPYCSLAQSDGPRWSIAVCSRRSEDGEIIFIGKEPQVGDKEMELAQGFGKDSTNQFLVCWSKMLWDWNTSVSDFVWSESAAAERWMYSTHVFATEKFWLSCWNWLPWLSL